MDPNQTQHMLIMQALQDAGAPLDVNNYMAARSAMPMFPGQNQYQNASQGGVQGSRGLPGNSDQTTSSNVDPSFMTGGQGSGQEAPDGSSAWPWLAVGGAGAGAYMAYRHFKNKNAAPAIGPGVQFRGAPQQPIRQPAPQQVPQLTYQPRITQQGGTALTPMLPLQPNPVKPAANAARTLSRIAQ